MVLFIDETGNNDFFIVAGLLLPSKQDAEVAYKHFKHQISNYKLAPKTKQRIYKEFKATKLDHGFQNIKKKMLLEIKEIDGAIIYSCYMIKNAQFNQALKEATYIVLLSNIVATIKEPVDIIFDSFSKEDFEANIIRSMQSFEVVNSIMPCHSELEPGLQFIDNICSAIRLHEADSDKDGFYIIIEEMVASVKFL